MPMTESKDWQAEAAVDRRSDVLDLRGEWSSRGLPSGASSKGALRGVQDVSYSLAVASSSPGYSFADQGRELPGGGA
ncbi:UNVERIFIED_CONTAM: hypothetical protein FKN15_071035 [Acipenser sinensis]